MRYRWTFAFSCKCAQQTKRAADAEDELLELLPLSKRQARQRERACACAARSADGG